jgi:hypothetical protein
VGGVLGSVEVEQLAEDSAGASSRVRRKRQGVHLGNQGVIEIVGRDEGSLLGRGDFGSLCGSGRFAGEQPFVRAIAELPELKAHAKGSDEEQG